MAVVAIICFLATYALAQEGHPWWSLLPFLVGLFLMANFDPRRQQ